MKTKFILFLIGVLCLAASPYGFGGGDVVINLDVTRSLDFTSDQSSFQLTFDNYRQGAVTNEVSVNYTFSGNSVTRMTDLVSARVDQDLPGINFQAQMGAFSKKSGDAVLVPSRSGFATLGTLDTGLANKVIQSGSGLIVDGTASITYRAAAAQNLSAGQHTVVIIVTFADN
ncbi:MAG: hypothetical protein WC352_00315 [Candidatus Omnitrophota bacterium]|jgi:hypothetical protein